MEKNCGSEKPKLIYELFTSRTELELSETWQSGNDFDRVFRRPCIRLPTDNGHETKLPIPYLNNSKILKPLSGWNCKGHHQSKPSR